MIEAVHGIAGPDDLRRLHGLYPARYPFLLQSTSQNAATGRYDILFAFPGQFLEVSAGVGLTGSREPAGDSFLETLDEWWYREQVGAVETDLPFHGGWFIYLGYELAAAIEPRLRLKADELLPAAFAVRVAEALVFDHREQRCYFVSETGRPDLRDRLADDLRKLGTPVAGGKVDVRSVSEEHADLFLDAVRAAKRYIEAGDIYQANLSRGWSAELSGQTRADQVYAALCASNPAPFAGSAHWRGVDVLSSSPERLLQCRHGRISTRPIAGTRPRSRDGGTDSSLSAELLAHPKEIAEHVMLIDLERNDLGRVCAPGSVRVDEMMVLESYAHVHHIVSNVTGTLRAAVTPGQAIAAVFPGGTITGCPKVRCMEIISELETAPRGAYTGSMGYLNRDGSMDLNILIRTMVLQGNTAAFRAGSGIVADSDAEAELAETRAKAEGLLRALRT